MSKIIDKGGPIRNHFFGRHIWIQNYPDNFSKFIINRVCKECFAYWGLIKSVYKEILWGDMAY